MGSRHSNSNQPNKKSSNEIYCDGLVMKLNRVYDPEKHGDNSDRYFELEEIKSTIDKTVNQ